MQLLYRQSWVDDRLKFIDTSVPKIVGDDYHAQRIWTPSIHAVNNKDVGTTFGGETDLLHIEPNGKVLLCRR